MTKNQPVNVSLFSIGSDLDDIEAQFERVRNSLLRRWNRAGIPSSILSLSRIACSIASPTFSFSTRLTSIWIPGRPRTSGISPKVREPPR